jgi:hypothetical protein
MEELRLLEAKGDILLYDMFPQAFVDPDLAFLPFANVSVAAASTGEAKIKIGDLWASLGFEDTEEKPCSYYLRTF